jgi:hypothetical protein
MANSNVSPGVALRRRDWVRFQVKASRIVLEGFVQELSSDGRQIRVGKGPDSPENTWYSLDELTILHHQSR